MQQHVTSSESQYSVTALSAPESNKRKKSRSSKKRGKGRGKQKGIDYLLTMVIKIIYS